MSVGALSITHFVSRARIVFSQNSQSKYPSQHIYSAALLRYHHPRPLVPRRQQHAPGWLPNKKNVNPSTIWNGNIIDRFPLGKMIADDARFLKKHIKTGNIDVHPTEKALIVNYELEATILGEMGDPMVGDRKECQKLIRLKDLAESTDIMVLAKEIVEKCKLIPLSKVPEVEQLLFYLQKRGDHGLPGRGGVSLGGDGGLSADFGDIGSEVEERASINKLEDYIEILYEDIGEKVRGTALLLQLARNPDNLEELISNETLLGALARVLREDWKKNVELATNIVYIFFCFSTFSQFHSMISHFKVGALCMQILEYELKRYDLWKEDVRQKSSQNPKEAEKNKRKFQALVKKQEQLLRVSLYLLLNLSEDMKTEIKMVNRGMTEMLCRVLERRDNPELLILAATFLKKLSVFAENIPQMVKGGVVEKAGKVLPSGPPELSAVLLGLLFNVSFHTELRKKIVSAGFLNHIVPHISNPTHQETALRLLYHLSMDDDCKAMFTYTDCIPVCMGLLLEQKKCPLPLKSLLINLAIHKRNAQLLAGDDGKGLRLLMELAFQNKDPLILKIVRNIAEHDGATKPMFIDFVSDFAEAIKKNEVRGVGCLNDFGLECLGLLGCMNLPELDWGRLLEEFNLLHWIRSKLKPGGTEDDVMLEILVLMGTVATDPGGADLLLREALVDASITILSAKQEDDEIVLQIIYVFYQMMFHDRMRKKLLADTQVPAYLIDLMHDKNQEIRKMCDNTLDVIAENGEEWAVKIQEEKFRWHNAQWLDMLSQNTAQDHPDPDDLSQDFAAYDAPDVFQDMYGMQAEDILDNYENEDRPISRLGHQSVSSSDDEPSHPFK